MDRNETPPFDSSPPCEPSSPTAPRWHATPWDAAIQLRDQHDAMGVSRLQERIGFVQGGLLDALGGDEGAVVFSTRSEAKDDPMLGFRPVWFQSTRSSRMLRALRRLLPLLRWTPQVDVPTHARLRGEAGAHVLSVSDLPEGSSHRRLAELLGVRHRVLLEMPVSPLVSSFLLVDRKGEAPFDARDEEAARSAAVVLRHACVGWANHLGLLDGKLLTPRELDVQQGLLDGLSEKQVAAALGLSTSYVHQIVVSLYKKRRVSSRGEWFAKVVNTQTPAEHPIPTRWYPLGTIDG